MKLIILIPAKPKMSEEQSAFADPVEDHPMPIAHEPYSQSILGNDFMY